MRENVENLRAFLKTWSREAWTTETWQRGDAIDMQFFDGDVTYEDTVLPDHIGEAYHGHEGVARAGQRWLDSSEWLLVELEEIVGAGDCLVSIHRVRSKALYTATEFETSLADVWTLRDGKVIHFQSFLDPEKAIAAAELRARPS